MSTPTITRDDQIALAQIEALAHTALDTGEALAGEVRAALAGDVFTVTVTLDEQYRDAAPYWLSQVRDELRIAARSGLLRDARIEVTR